MSDKDTVMAPSPDDLGLDTAPHLPRNDERSGKPPRARVEDAIDETPRETMERKRDYLDGFLAKQPDAVPAGEPGGELHDAVIAALKEIYDPEIPVNIYDLGLIYGVEVDDEADVTVTMTLTTPHCPVAESMPGEVELRAPPASPACAMPRSIWSGIPPGTPRR